MTKEQWMWMHASVALVAAARRENEGRSVMQKHPELYQIGPAVPQFGGPPSPPEIDWREIVRKNAI